MYLSKVLLVSAFASGWCNAAPQPTPQLRDFETRDVVQLDSRSTCKGKHSIAVYESYNSGSEFLICVNAWVIALCSIGIAGGYSAVGALPGKISDWINKGTADASDAAPKRRDVDSALTWGDLFAYQNSTVAAAETTPLSIGNISDGNDFYQLYKLELHEDGFSASLDLRPNTTDAAIGRRAVCKEQMHVHYWAAAGHRTTILHTDQLERGLSAVLKDSYYKDRAKA